MTEHDPDVLNEARRWIARHFGEHVAHGVREAETRAVADLMAARDAWKRLAEARGRVTYAWTDPIKDAARALLDGGKP